MGTLVGYVRSVTSDCKRITANCIFVNNRTVNKFRLQAKKRKKEKKKKRKKMD
jgi:hypothetical protein